MRIIFIIILLSFGTKAKPEGIFSWLFGSGEEIISEIKLVNKCQLDSKYFVVRDLESGKTAAFINGKAKLPTKAKSSIQLQLSSSVKHVIFEGNAVSAKLDADLTALGASFSQTEAGAGTALALSHFFGAGMSGRFKQGGSLIDPSSCWPFSIRAIKVLEMATAVPFSM